MQLPLFPLPLVVFPGERIPLHIFEERYKQMMKDCLRPENKESAVSFGITCATDEAVQSTGCAVKMEQILKTYDDGRMDIMTKGVVRFRIDEIERTESYAIAQVTPFEDHPTGEQEKLDIPYLQDVAISLHSKLVDLANETTVFPKFERTDTISFLLAHSAGLDLSQRQALLEMRSEKERLDYLVQYYRRVIPLVQDNRDLKERIQANGHIRKLTSLPW